MRRSVGRRGERENPYVSSLVVLLPRPRVVHDDGVKKKKKVLQKCITGFFEECGTDSVCLAVGGVVWLVGHGALGVAEVLALVHGKASGAAAEAVSLGAELPAVALLAEEFTTVLGGVGAVQPLVTESAHEACPVPLGTCC